MKTFFLKMLFDDGTRRKTWRKLSALLRHSISQRQALTMLRDRYAARKHPLNAVFSAVLTETENGQPLDVALFPWVPHEELMLIRGGVGSGKLPEALQDCAELIDARVKITQSLIGAVSYPALLLGLFFTLILVLAFYVMPELSMLSNPASWGGAAGLLYAFCSFVASPAGLLCFLLFVFVLIASVCTLPFWTGPARLLVDNIPPWSIYRLVVGSVWLFTMATLMRAGFQLENILRDMIESGIMRPWLAERVRAIKDRYRSEGNFGTLLLHLDMKFPDTELVEELAVFATLPNFHVNMYAIAKEWLDEGVVRIGKQAQIINAALICLIIALVCCLGLAIGSMQEQINNGMGGF